MKRIFLVCGLAPLILLTSCVKELDLTSPHQVSERELLKNTENAQVALNGIYRSLYKPSSGYLYTEFNRQSFPGISGMMLRFDLYGEDMVMAGPGSGWFWYDYLCDVNSRFNSDGWPSYGVWNFYYKLIHNANRILDKMEAMVGSQEEKDRLKGQCLAIRGYAYFYLSIVFCQLPYEGSNPGVPIYTTAIPEGDVPEGKPRGILQDVYERVEADLLAAHDLLHVEKIWSQRDPIEIDQRVVAGFLARYYLVKGINFYPKAAEYAKEARQGLELMKEKEGATLGEGFNDLKNFSSNLIWGAEIIKDESDFWGTFFCHMDAGHNQGYAVRAQKCISRGLYDQIDDSDPRRNWWKDGNLASGGKGEGIAYCQVKFKWKDYSNNLGDFIYMRAEEMLLIEAEASCLGDPDRVYELLDTLYEARDIGSRLAATEKLDNGPNSEYKTYQHPVSLLEEVLLQRRIELWGEVGRWFDLRRLSHGLDRVYENSNHGPQGQVAKMMDYLTIPQAEFDGNHAMDADKDQNK